MQTVRYGPYGENTNTSGTLAYSTTNDPFLFQGGYHLAGGNAGTGQRAQWSLPLRARYYDPTTGRWTQPDPAASLPEYAFAGDDPVNANDPSGECWADQFGTWGPDCAGNPLITAKGGGGPEVVVKCFTYYASFPETEQPGWRKRCVPKTEGWKGCKKALTVPTNESLGEITLDALADPFEALIECYKGARTVETR